jgi:hypothetical protein
MIVNQFPIIQKPKFGQPCNRCGFCCQEEACVLSREFLHSDIAPCIALEIEPDGRFSCGLLKRPSHYLAITLPGADEILREQFSALWTGMCCSEVLGEGEQ